MRTNLSRTLALTTILALGAAFAFPHQARAGNETSTYMVTAAFLKMSPYARSAVVIGLLDGMSLISEDLGPNDLPEHATESRAAAFRASRSCIENTDATMWPDRIAALVHARPALLKLPLAEALFQAVLLNCEQRFKPTPKQSGPGANQTSDHSTTGTPLSGGTPQIPPHFHLEPIAPATHAPPSPPINPTFQNYPSPAGNSQTPPLSAFLQASGSVGAPATGDPRWITGNKTHEPQNEVQPPQVTAIGESLEPHDRTTQEAPLTDTPVYPLADRNIAPESHPSSLIPIE